MEHPRTAILVLSFNGKAVTEKFLSLLYENTSNFDLIMVDNGSTDGSAKYLSDFSKQHSNMNLVLNDSNLGVIKGRNFAYDVYLKSQDRADHICFLDNDQFVQKNWLEHHFAVLQQSQADLVGVEAWTLSKTFKPIQQCKRQSTPWTYVGCGGMLMKSSVPAQIGMFDPQFNPCYFEDPDYCFRAMDAGFRIAWNAKAKLVHLPHQTLGKNPNKVKNFLESHAKFASKWKGRPIRDYLQMPVDALK